MCNRETTQSLRNSPDQVTSETFASRTSESQVAHFQKKAVGPISLSRVTNDSAHFFRLQHCWPFTLLLAMLFQLRKINTNIVQRMACARDFHVGQRLCRFPCKFLRQIQINF